MKTKIIAVTTLLLTLGIFLTFWLREARASDASDVVTFQGKLSDAAGTPLPDGQYWIGARVWNQASGGNTPLWAMKYQVPVSSGTFVLMLGSSGTAWNSPTPLSTSLKPATSGGDRWVEITVMSDANGSEKPEAEWKILAPRQSLTSVPFAHNGVPTGTVIAFAGTTAPPGWTICDGQSRDGNDPRFRGLFEVIGLTYGGSGTSFNVPDMRGRTAIGAGQGPALSNRAIGQKMGAETHTLSAFEMPAHSHTGRTNHDGDHSHTTSGNAASDDGGGSDTHFALGDNDAGRNWIGIGIGGGAHSHAFTTDVTGGNGAHNIMQPSLVLNYMIKL